MPTITVKLSHELDSRLKAIVRKRGISKSEVVREAIERMTAAPAAPAPSALDLLGDLCGAGSGPADLSTNPKYMEGFGE